MCSVPDIFVQEMCGFSSCCYMFYETNAFPFMATVLALVAPLYVNVHTRIELRRYQRI